MRASGGEVEPDHRGEHDQPAEQRVEEELDRRVLPARAAERPDQEVHRDQHGLEEHVEEEDVGGREDPDHHHLEQQQQPEERLRLAAAGAGHPGWGGVRVGHQHRVGGRQDVRVVVVGRPVQDRGGRPDPAGGPAHDGCLAAARAATPRSPAPPRRPAVPLAPGRDHHCRHQHGGERDEHQRDPVHTEREAHPERPDPLVRRDELEPLRGVVVERDAEADRESPASASENSSVSCLASRSRPRGSANTTIEPTSGTRPRTSNIRRTSLPAGTPRRATSRRASTGRTSGRSRSAAGAAGRSRRRRRPRPR